MDDDNLLKSIPDRPPPGTEESYSWKERLFLSGEYSKGHDFYLRHSSIASYEEQEDKQTNSCEA